MNCFFLSSYCKNVHLLIPLQSVQYSCTPAVIIQSFLAVLWRNFVYSQFWGTLFNKENWSFASPAGTCDFRLQQSKRVEIERASFELGDKSSKKKMPAQTYFLQREEDANTCFFPLCCQYNAWWSFEVVSLISCYGETLVSLWCIAKLLWKQYYRTLTICCCRLLPLTCALLLLFFFVLSAMIFAATDPILSQPKGSGRAYFNTYCPNGTRTERHEYSKRLETFVALMGRVNIKWNAVRP